ncbi:TPA: hypothetical protein ACH3X1_015751 [Trebouxia sp. C0004]
MYLAGMLPAGCSASAILQQKLAMAFVTLIVLLCGTAAQPQCTIGGSTRYCGYVGGNPQNGVSGGYSQPCHCQPTLCCSQTGYCGPEPTITTDPATAYCGTGCQANYGNCNPGNVFFEYIGTGETGAPDTVNTQATINKITTPSNTKGSFYWILFALTDQIANFQGMGQQTTTSSGNWVPTGVFDAGGNYSSTQIGYLKAKGKVMASLAADATVWAGVSNEADYVTRTTASLQSYITNFGLTGFDIDYEKGMVTNTGRADASWLRVWSQVIYNLKKANTGLIITFAPFSYTQQAYKDLQNTSATQYNTNIDFIIFQTYDTSISMSQWSPTWTSLQQFYAPAKIIAGLSNRMADPTATINGQSAGSANLVSQYVQPAINSSVLTGASIFDADTSSTLNPAFKLESQLFS